MVVTVIFYGNEGHLTVYGGDWTLALMTQFVIFVLRIVSKQMPQVKRQEQNWRGFTLLHA